MEIHKRIFCLILFFASKGLAETQRPNIIYILADDLGYNDVSFHGSSQIPTPNIDALAYSGIILNRYYVSPLCSPSRAALMTGKYPIKLGMQHDIIRASEPRGLSLNETLMPEYFNELGYKSHITGKWHLGYWKKEFTPLYRGFESHVGQWVGYQDYYDHTAFGPGGWGYDMRRGMDVAWDLHGQYTTDIITQESIKIINQHDQSDPLFLYIAHLAVHSSNGYNSLPAPDEVVAEMGHIEDFKRRKFAAVLTKLDRSVGDVIQALKAKNMLENSIIVFSTDNGGAPQGFNLNHGSNWPLRGAKYNLWEGGVRGAALIWSPLLKQQQRVSNQLMHITDWLPTLYHAAGGNISDLPENLDGINLWEELSNNEESPRNEVLLNIDDSMETRKVLSLISGNYKLLSGSSFNGNWDGWYGPMGDRDPLTHDTNKIKSSKAGDAMNNLQQLPNVESIEKLRAEASINCISTGPDIECHPNEEFCLFDIVADPCERRNIAAQYPEIVEELKGRILAYSQIAIPPDNKPVDKRGSPKPKLWQNCWTNFGDFI